MSGYRFTLQNTPLVAMATGALFHEASKTLVVSDLHLGKSERILRRGGPHFPPFDTEDTLGRLERDIDQTAATRVICLGDSFDDTAAAVNLCNQNRQWIVKLQQGRTWIWITGNHDPAPLDLGGVEVAEYKLDGLICRHIANTESVGEISGHYHPKARLKTPAGSVVRPCFAIDAARVIMPAYGTFTGGLFTDAIPIQNILSENAIAVLTGQTAHAIPLPK